MTDAAPDLSRLRIDRARGPRGARGGWIACLLLVLLFGTYVAWNEGLFGVDERPAVVVAPTVRRGGAPAPSGTAANGYVVARRKASLSTDIQGRIVELRAEEGDRVAAGELIARLDTRQLEASLAQARAELEREMARAELARLEYERREVLFETGDVRLEELDEAATARQESEAAVRALQARIDEVGVMIDNSSIHAPFDGVVTAKNAEVGEVVSTFGNARDAVITLVDFETLEVQVELAQTSLPSASLDGPAQIFLDAYPTRPYRGRVHQIWPTADRQKATVEVRVAFLERDDRILPEMGVRVVFLEGETPPNGASGANVVLVPARALTGQDDAPAVFLLIDGRAVLRAIQPAGPAMAGQLPVAEGLEGGELVILDPPAGLADGDAVRVRSEAP